ncbi:MAG: DegQ family serine endoprotease [Pseudomonadota bacterium]|nr:DegQ family serine endoprotease [Pseudomonadota bacterium]
MRQGKFNRLVSVLLVLALAACGRVGESHHDKAAGSAPDTRKDGASSSGLTLNSGPLVPQGAALPDFTLLVEKAGSAVVNISTTQKIRAGMGGDDAEGDADPFGEFFRRFGPPHGASPPDLEARSLGSGFIVSNDGYIMTNAHVVANADEVVVRLTDKREFKAKVVGSDRRTDVALLKIKAEHLPAVSIGDPAHLKVGEWVIAIGSPFGFDSTVTKGIVSAVGRSLPDENYTPFIQTDAAVNPGNSGGPLFNLRGEVVGINSQIYSRTGGFMGISFAIPIDLAINVSNQLKTTGKVTRGRLGVRLQDVTADLAQSFGLDRAHGALVAQVERESPAARAGLQGGDIILRYGDRDVESSKDLPGMVGSTPPGQAVKLEIWRKGGRHTVEVKVGELQSDTINAAAEPNRSERLGHLADLSDEQKHALGVNHGVLVEAPKANAARAGLRRGDVILAVNNQDVEDVDAIDTALARVPSGHTVALLVRRGDDTLYVAVHLE